MEHSNARNRDDLTLAVGEAVRVMRNVSHLTVDQAAEQCRLARSVYYRIEQGIRVADVGQLNAIAEGFGLYASEVLRFAERIAESPTDASEMIRKRLCG